MTQAAPLLHPEAPAQDNFPAFARGPHAFLLERAIAGGPDAHFRLGSEPFFVLGDPDAVHGVLNGSLDDWEKGDLYEIPRTIFGDGIFTSDGQEWIDHRTLMTPLFAQSRMRRLGHLISDLATRQVDGWAAAARTGSDGDGPDPLMATKRMAFDVVSRGLLGMRDEAMADRLFDAVAKAESVDAVTLSYFARRVSAGDALAARFGRSDSTLARDRAREASFEVADERLERDEEDDDLLGAVIASPMAAGLSPERRRRFTRDMVATVISAGYISTGESMFWALYALAGDPEAQQRARAEVLERNRAELDGAADSLHRPLLDPPPYVAAVLNESLRLYPPLWFIGRITRRALRIEGVEIAAGTRVICSPYVLHRNPQLWPDPEQFRPERFLSGAPRMVPRSFIPFGGGMRACLGRTLAMMEMSALVSATLLRFELRLISDRPPALMAAYSMQPRDRRLFELRPLA